MVYEEAALEPVVAHAELTISTASQEALCTNEAGLISFLSVSIKGM